MDKEQINELKPGDEVLIRGTFKKIKENGDFQVSYLLTTVHDKLYMYKTAVHPSAVIIKSPPKHDPTRLFKEGDKVQVISLNGRCCGKYGEYLRGAHCIVLEDEPVGLGVKVRHNADDYILDPAYLVLVTPAEELEPYSVEESCGGANLHCFILKRGEKHLSYYLYRSGNANHFYTREEAKAAAGAECERLNAEYRKEAANG